MERKTEYCLIATDSVAYPAGGQESEPEMFKLSKKADYGLIAVKHLAMHRQEHACSANEIADEYGISVTLMAKVLQRLAREASSLRSTVQPGAISWRKTLEMLVRWM